ncbi:MAG TPA: phosphatase PAP2 family protein, partial [Polyangiaceae bacterium LLY-WYZ-15_(1-7)]|nr:phosphatase PAP2 family protein [Polyangiaceae bacterium LLY-WYZ-15_(1-7)]
HHSLWCPPMRALLPLLVLAAALAPARPAHAQRLVWEDEWDSSLVADWTAIGASTAAALTISLAISTDEPWWRTIGPFDRGSGEALTLDDPPRRRRAALASDILGLFTLSLPVFVDPIVAFVDAPPVARELARVNFRSFTVLGAALAALKYGFRRQRPGDCDAGRLPPDPRCERSDSNRSFPSGHAAFAFAAAGLTCAAHLHLPLYGSRSLDAATCAVSLGTATLTSLLRVVAGRHHLSDVIVGAILGFLAGWVLPAAANYGFRPGV